MSEQQQWYTNKELFEKITSVQQDMRDVSAEMRETRNIIKKYNGLREELYEVKDKVEDIEARQEGMKQVWENIRNWGGWIFAMITLFILLYNTFGR